MLWTETGKVNTRRALWRGNQGVVLESEMSVRPPGGAVK